MKEKSGNGRNNRSPRKDDHAGLRRRAEKRLEQRAGVPDNLYDQDKERIIHELGTYQIELELQNEDLKAAQVELDDSRRRYLDLYDYAPVGYVSLSPNGNILSINLTMAFMLEEIKSELLQMPFSMLVADKDQDTFLRHLWQTARQGKRQSAELQLLKKESAPFHANLESIPVRDGSGEVAEIRTTVTDITEKKMKELEIMDLNRELLRSNEDLLHFAHIVSHDLQEPLRTVSSFVQLLERKYDHLLDDKAHQYMKHIVGGTEHMRHLLNDLLTFSRVGSAGLANESVSLQRVVEKVQDNLAETIRANDAEIISESLPVVTGDETLITDLVLNLVSNSLKYRGDEPPRITISADSENESWVVCVRDNGIGIEPRYADQIFNIFQRLHLLDEFAGTGIGLAICKRIVERHGGRIWVDSVPGKGAAFYFSLPKKEVNLYV